METLDLLLNGLGTLLRLEYITFAVLGCVLGTIIGVLPGVGPAAGTSILIPVTFVLDPIQAIIMLAAIYYGALYGGTITSVLLNTPGEAASAITCLEGYPMAQRGRGGAALTIGAIASCIGGTFSTMLLVVVALPLSAIALRFGPPEFFALMIVGMSLVTGLAGASMVRAFISAGLGLMIAMVGIDPVVGAPRLTLGMTSLLDGVPFVPIAMGLFAIGEIMLNVEEPAKKLIRVKMRWIMLSRQEAKDSVMPVVRGTAIGASMGFIPGVGQIVPAVMSYVAEKRWSRNREKFGTGAIEGVAGPEAANNAYSVSAMIPLFTLGIPSSPTIAILMGAFMMHGLVPGPTLFTDHPGFTWTVIASLVVGDFILLFLNVPLIPLWVQILRVPRPLLYTGIIMFTILGSFSLSNRLFDVGVMFLFGLVGYLFRKVDVPLAPMVLTLVLGPLMERSLRRSLEMSAGDFGIFFTRPLSAALLIVAVVALLVFSLKKGTPVVKVPASEGTEQ